MSNNIFQFNRVGKLIGRTFKQNSRTFLNNTLVLAGLPILFFLIARLLAVNVPSSLFRGDLLAFLVGTIFMFSPFFYYYFYNHPKKGLSEVMLPASVLEKFVVMQLVCAVFAPLMVLVFYGASDVLMVTLFPKHYSGYAITEFFYNIFKSNGKWLIFLTLQAVFFANLFFVRRKILKSIASFMVVNLLLGIFIVIGITVMEYLGYYDASSGNMNIYAGDRGLFEFYLGDPPLVIISMITRLFMGLVLPILFMIGSYRLMKTNRY